jgi:radical SAM superfamily enzyme YgiQ (UPF0313 family)
MKKKKLLLIYPKNFIADYSDTQRISIFGKRGVFMSASLATVAALTPPEIEVKIIDENVEPINFNEPVDLVGITGFHFHLPQARQIAKEFSKRGVTVVCGGPSVSLSTERWRPIADVLIIGEAERIWPEFIEDYLAERHQHEYRESERFDLSISPVPDYSGFSEKSRKEFLAGVVQTSRGCPFNCDFCSVHVYLGHKMRYKPTDHVLQEVEQLHRMGFRGIFLADDNFQAGRKKAWKILEALRDWNRQQRQPIKFATQLSIDVAEDEAFLELAAEAGLGRVYIGIESPNVESLKEIGKVQNVQSDMLEDIKKFHVHGITVIGSTIVGFDHDDLSIFQQQFDFFKKAGIPKVHVYPLQARDGTRLKERMLQEGRYIDWEGDQNQFEENDSRYRNFESFTIMPKQMSLDQLRDGIYWLVWNLYKPENVFHRLKTFFEHFENSPKKGRLKFPRRHLDRSKITATIRILKYYFKEADPTEKRILREMLRLAGKSSAPNKFQMAIVEFFMAKNIRETLLMQNPKVDQTTYPEPDLSQD